jgi:CheY-like chemotaxis protein
MTELKRILLVEDNQKDIDLALAALAENELADEVIVVRDGEQAIDYLHQRGNFLLRARGNPAVILLDLKLPKVDGLEVLTQIKSDPQLKVIPVVMLTSSREEADLASSYQRGVNAYVVKPVTFTRFVDALRELGVFWAEINEPPPGSIGRRANRRI